MAWVLVSVACGDPDPTPEGESSAGTSGDPPTTTTASTSTDPDTSTSTSTASTTDADSSTTIVIPDVGESPCETLDPPPEVLATGDIQSLGDDATRVYFADWDRDLSGVYQGDGKIGAVDKATGDVEILVSNEEQPTQPIADDTHVYFHNYVTHEIRRVPKDGGDVETVVDLGGTWSEIAIDGDDVVWTLRAEGATPQGLFRAPKDGSGPPVNLDMATIGTRSGFAIADGVAYYASDDGIRSVPLDGSPASTITANAQIDLAVLGDELWYIGDDQLWVVSTAGGEPEAIELERAPYALTVADGYVWWGSTEFGIEGGCGGGIFRTDATHVVEEIVTAQAMVLSQDLVVDAGEMWVASGQLTHVVP